MTNKKEVQDTEEEKPGPSKTSGQKISWHWIIGVGAAVVIVAAGLFLWINGRDRGSVQKPSLFSSQVTFPVPGKQEIRFDDFLIPLPADSAHTGVSLSVVIRYRDSEWSTITDQEKTWLRAGIYDRLLKEMEKKQTPPSEDMMAFWASRAVKEIFSDRPFDELIVDNIFML